MQASADLMVYYAEMVAERRKKPSDDLTSALLEAEIDGDRLTDDEIMAFLFLMVVAGNETTTKLLANAAYWGREEPRPAGAGLRRPLQDPAVGRGDAALRHLQPDPGPHRGRRADALRHHAFPTATCCCCCPGSANRDDRVFEDADEYRIGREIGSKLVSFGSGAHFCLGAHLARMEARVALTELFKRIRGYEVDEANAVRVHSSNVRGFAHLPDHGGDALDAPFRTTPRPQARDRRRRLVRDRRRDGHRARRPRLPGRARRPPRREVPGAGRPDPRRGRRSHRAAARCHRRRLGQGLRAPRHRGARRDRAAGGRRRRHLLRPAARDQHGRFRIAGADPSRSAPTGWPPRCCRAWSSANAATSSSSDPTSRCASARTWAPTAPPRPHWSRWSPTCRWNSRAPACARRSCIPVRRRPAWAGACPPKPIGPALEDWAKWGQARHDYFLRPADLARAIAFVAETPRGGFIANMEIQPEAPLATRQGTPEAQARDGGGMTVMTTAIVPRVSGGEEEHGHLEEFRTDPIGLMKRIREECGDVGWFQLVDKHVIFLSGAEANEFFFRSADEDLDQAEAYPFMTPIFGKGVVFDASPERRKEMLHNSALRGEQMKGHAATIEGEVKTDDRRLGRRRRDRSARLLRRADHLHLDGLPDRPEVPRPARPPVRALLPRTGTRHRSAVLRRPLPADRELPAPRRGPRQTRCAGAGDHGSAARQPAEGQERPRHARRAGVDQGRGRQRRGSPPTRSPACSSR